VGRPCEPLGEGDYVLCSDEKTSIQARCRCHPTLPPGRARLMRVEHEYDRGGALSYLAAWDVHRGKVFGRCEPTTGIALFAALVEQVMTPDRYQPPHDPRRTSAHDHLGCPKGDHVSQVGRPAPE
jgi:hypothetical protein